MKRDNSVLDTKEDKWKELQQLRGCIGEINYEGLQQIQDLSLKNAIDLPHNIAASF